MSIFTNLFKKSKSPYSESTIKDSLQSYLKDNLKVDNNKAISPAEAAKIDAKKDPPLPTSSEEIENEGYFSKFKEIIQSFSKEYADDTNNLFEINLKKIKSILERFEKDSTELEDKADVISVKLKENIENLKAKTDEFKEYKDEFNAQDWPKVTTTIEFSAFVFFILAGEFALVYWFLKQEIGLQQSILGSTIAFIVVGGCALLIAWFHACLARDVNKPVTKYNKFINFYLTHWKRVAFSLLIILVCAVYLFGLGVLSGYRGDSVDQGVLAVALSGYAQMGNIVILTTAFVNTIALITLAYKIRRFAWSKLYNYKAYAQAIAEVEQMILDDAKKLNKIIESLEEKVKSAENLAGEYADINRTDFTKILEIELRSWVNEYVATNNKWRTKGLYGSISFNNDNYYNDIGLSLSRNEQGQQIKKLKEETINEISSSLDQVESYIDIDIEQLRNYLNKFF